MFFSQKYIKEKEKKLVASAVRTEFYLAFLAFFFGFFIAVFLFHFALECLLAVSFVAGLEYIFFFLGAYLTGY